MTAKPRKGPNRLADLVRPALEPMLAKRGLTGASLILDWPVIAGAALARVCEPARLQWPPRGPKSAPSGGAPATLWLRVAPGRSLDVQYQAALIADRVNAFFGWRCVAKVAIAPEPKRTAAPSAQSTGADPALLAKAAAATEGVGDPALRAALTRLGAGVFGRMR